MALLNIEIFDAKKPDRSIIVLENVSPEESVLSLKRLIAQKTKPSIAVERQAIRLTSISKALSNESRLTDLNLPYKGAHLFLRDLGPQIAWKTVFLVEYGGPLLLYPIFYMRPSFIYGKSSLSADYATPVNLAFLCWTFHYAKRMFETLFIHRFSNDTMPMFNLFKNCSYYWGFAAFVSYFVNHPLYTSPYFGSFQAYLGLVGFALSELGNLSIHVLLRNLRPPGTRERKIPVPNSNAFTALFNLVSCPNYTYEAAAWLSFSVMTQCLPALMFTVAGFAQMAIWAKGKHRAYLKQFPGYPASRKAILPYLL